MAYYDLKKKKYVDEFFSEEMELLSFTGNVSWHEGKPVIHSHIALSNRKFQALGGHLIEAEVAVTVELFMSVRSQKIERSFDPEIGLNLLDL